MLPYLHDLGVDWVYLSPLLASEPGSTHGYDVVAFDHIDEERGGAEGLAAVSAEARRLGMGVLVDIVPNHVGVATPSEDPWWWDVLKLGRESEHANAFDVDWAAGDGRIVIPVIGDDDEDAIEVALSDRGRARSATTTSASRSRPARPRWRSSTTSWSTGARPTTGLNYRRFFAVNTLAAVRVEDPEVFAETHVEIKRWFDEGLVDGLRVDHPDGLRDPKRYLDDLAALTGGAYVLVEKILEPGEELLDSWATAGTTGYDALALIDRVLTDPAGEAPLTALEDRLRGESVDWHRMVRTNKRAVADGILHSEVLRITREVARVAEEADDDAVADAIGELLACFPVYRSYLPEGRDHLDQAFAAARASRPELATTYDLLEPVLHDEWGQPARRFQQTSGMVMAKGVEDCSFYRWSRLTSLNEVGGDPSVFAIGVDDFHDAMAARQRDWPDAMVTLSTHDTKRGEDVRARITVLAEEPGHWERALDELLRLAPVPDPGFGSLLWQAVLGAWTPDHLPDLRERLHGYAEKAMREAGDRTTWTEPDEAYEAAGARRGRRGLRRRRRCGRCCWTSRPGSTSPRRPTRSRPSCSRSPSRACPTSTRAASSGRPRSSTPTTVVPSTSTTAPPCSPAPPRTTPPPSCTSPARRSRCAASGPSSSPPTPRSPHPARPPATWWRTTAAARSPSSPASPSVSTRPGGATPRSTCPRAGGTTCSPGSTPTAGWPTCSRRTPSRCW